MAVQSESTTIEQLEELIIEKNYDNASKLADISKQKDEQWASRPEVQVMLARLHLRLGNERALKSAERTRHHADAFELVKKCEASEELKDDYMMHYLMAVIAGKVSEVLGLKKKIVNAYVIRDHARRALELRPDHAGPRLVLGKWCLEVASISKISRLAAKALFGAPPEATLEEAHAHLIKSIELDYADSPLYATNLLTMAQCCGAMKKMDDAQKWYDKCANSRSEQSANVRESNHEKEVRAQAAAALAKLKKK